MLHLHKASTSPTLGWNRCSGGHKSKGLIGKKPFLAFWEPAGDPSAMFQGGCATAELCRKGPEHRMEFMPMPHLENPA